ncbi:MAG: hypothetical protein GY874_01160 [Desulfobacteraceae bacterium]|nr:hypothetical protein [Desulfobacteraceae bacterium]
MNNQSCVLIIGAGRFAVNYINVISGLADQARKMPMPFFFDHLIVTRTQQAGAETLAGKILHKYSGIWRTVTGCQVINEHQLEKVLERYRPGLICLTARDNNTGDGIHAHYSPKALNYGALLCEKPYSSGCGNGASLVHAQRLREHPHAARFGLHLPMMPVLHAMENHDYLGPVLAGARELEFLWQSETARSGLINDLAVHPWSLIPTIDPVTIDKVDATASSTGIRFSWNPVSGGGLKTGKILLQTGGLFRGMRLDQLVLRFGFAEGRLAIFREPMSWNKILDGNMSSELQEVLIAVDNPLKQHLLAMINLKPICDVEKTYLSQQFIERLYGFELHRK